MTTNSSGAPMPATRAPSPPMPAAPLPATPAADGSPITDVNTLQLVDAAVAAQIKSAAGYSGTPGVSREEMMAMPAEAPAAAAADKPGSERWPVKTGQDQDRAKVGKNVINGENLGAGIVPTTIDELISLPRPPGLQVATQDPPQFKSVRDGVTEVTIWTLQATITALKHEADGDYHLVLQSKSGVEMVAEIPTPTTQFVGDSPWLNNIKQARQAVDTTLVGKLSPAAFTLVNDKYLPQQSLASTDVAAAAPAPAGMSFTTPEEGSGLTQPLFATRISPTAVQITGVGFFDRAHGATGAAPNVIELHPVLKVVFSA
jgi:hypothetical protein